MALLDGRDGISPQEWLKSNKQVKKVSRDRADAYAKAITQELPKDMQIANRFHLHQNLLQAVKEALRQTLPNQIAIPNPGGLLAMDDATKTPKNELTNAEQRRYENIIRIQTLIAEGVASSQIKRLLPTTYNRIRSHVT